MSTKPGIPKGTRDFLPDEMQKRNYIFSTIESVFRNYGFLPIETPAMEMLSTLTGKYGDEGDQLMFRILNSGDFLNGIQASDIESGYKKLSPTIAEKALRYDLTIPFARVVATHQNELHFPFRRYQIQAVWRADRPQKGRYREFYQCDADIIGSDALTLEAELSALYAQVFEKLGIHNISICLNNRKILAGIAEVCNIPDRLTEFTIALDKLDKIGADGVKQELLNRGFMPETVAAIFDIKPLFFPLQAAKDMPQHLSDMKSILQKSETGLAGIHELEQTYQYIQALYPEALEKVVFDFTLARGLNYYTGVIFEVRVHDVKMGSIGGGGRYDDLSGMFGLKNMSGVGISFGADRIYDVMEELKVFPENLNTPVKCLIINFGAASAMQNLKVLAELRKENIASEYYPDEKKLQKQIEYAIKKRIPYILMQGEDEIQQQIVKMKYLDTGQQEAYSLQDAITVLSQIH
jgi:histidyl-tRNA synthetase